jgi:hypothetical protein
MTLARVVLPVPGGPDSMMDERRSRWIALRSKPPGTDNMVLPYELVQNPGPHAIRQWPRSGRPGTWYSLAAANRSSFNLFPRPAIRPGAAIEIVGPEAITYCEGKDPYRFPAERCVEVGYGRNYPG